MRVFGIVAICAALSGCVTTQEQIQADQQTRMETALTPWIGQSVASYVAVHGDPTTSVALNEHTTAFRWVMTGSSTGAVIPVMGTLMVVPPRQLQCMVAFQATTSAKTPQLKDFTITKYTWEGVC